MTAFDVKTTPPVDPPLPSPKNDLTPVVIVGGGLSGLEAGLRLLRSGYSVTLLEAGDRLGGRVHTDYKQMGQAVELGGEFINSDHHLMLWRARQYDLPIKDLSVDPDNANEVFFSMNGMEIDPRKLEKLLVPFAQQVISDYDTILPYYDEDRYGGHPKALELDNMSVRQYLDRLIEEGKIDPLLQKFLPYALTGEFGIEIERYSALYLVEFLAEEFRGAGPELFEIGGFGGGDIRYTIDGGNSHLVDSMELDFIQRGGKIERGAPVQSISSLSDGSYEVHYDNGGTVKTCKAGVIIISAPPPAAKNIDLSKLEVSSSEEEAKSRIERFMNESIMGTNSKVILGFSKPITDSPLLYMGREPQNGDRLRGIEAWKNVRKSSEDPSALTIFLGGEAGANLSPENVPEYRDEILSIIGGVFPQSKETFDGRVASKNWSRDPYIGGSYLAKGVGQALEFADEELRRLDRVYFAGEHLAGDYQGYMEGALFSARIAARLIRNRFGWNK